MIMHLNAALNSGLFLIPTRNHPGAQINGRREWGEGGGEAGYSPNERDAA